MDTVAADREENLEAKELISYSFAKANNVLLQDNGEGGRAEVFCIGQPDINTIIEIKRVVQKEVTLKIVERDQFDDLLRSTYELDGDATATHVVKNIDDTFDLERLAEELPKTTDLLEANDEAPIIRLINALITQAIKGGSSDIHLEAFEKESTVRYRVDGVLREVLSLPREMHNAMISRLKVMSQLDISEKRLPQDGRMSLRVGEFPVDVRLSILPTQHGERAVLRLLDKQSARLDLTNLGMPMDLLSSFQTLVARPNGILLVTGPTGSGKTTTLYSALNQLDRKKLNVLTIEDPIEYDLPNVGQTQINNKVGLTFAGGLRSILRQDPDVVLIGEIRDQETAQIAIQASLTGHLVLSTLHTNTAIGAVTRLVDMGVEPFLISSSLMGVLAQRLVRTLCPNCTERTEITEAERATISDEFLKRLPTLPISKGCAECDQTGFKGRIGIYELIEMNNTLRDMIHDQASEHVLAEFARNEAQSLFENGIELVVAGKTTLDEVVRVTQEQT